MASKSVLIDNMIVSWGIRGEANPGQEHLIEWTRRFLEQCAAERIDVYIPAPVMGESLLRVPVEDHASAVATYIRRFHILPFDMPAALDFARIWQKREPTIRREDWRGGAAPKKALYRFDCQIVAIAVSRKVHCIYSHDRDVHRFGEGEIEVREIPEPAPVQQKLL